MAGASHELKARLVYKVCRPGVEATQRNCLEKQKAEKQQNKKTQMAGRQWWSRAEFETSLVYRIKLVLGQPRTQKNPVSERDLKKKKEKESKRDTNGGQTVGHAFKP